jgi:recombinational DNA repair ATPase RecF
MQLQYTSAGVHKDDLGFYRKSIHQEIWCFKASKKKLLTALKLSPNLNL